MKELEEQLEEICNLLGVRLQSLKRLAERIYNACMNKKLAKSGQHIRKSYTIKELQLILGYGDYLTFRDHMLVLIALCKKWNMGQIWGCALASWLKVVASRILIDPEDEEQLRETEGLLLEYEDTIRNAMETLHPILFSLFPYATQRIAKLRAKAASKRQHRFKVISEILDKRFRLPRLA